MDEVTDDLCPHRVENEYCDRPTDPNEVYCGRHGGADAEPPRTTHASRWYKR